ncbi:glycosyltransferase [Erwinia persicina]|uniref:glycosyltransferase n=1 Tax=Erwinia persicina TaxID=55211 RepID=UPI0021026C52|nr:glycosyltransferase [Erwinia persicina]MCQ4104659.1 glycosyltransferase [Erwinia persicina]UTX14360.1 glycosyltransferase [Erwinia persicina]
MKILFVISGLQMGGAEAQVCELADNLTYLGEEVSIVCLSGEVIRKPENADIKIYNLNIEKKPASVLLGMMKLRKIIKNFNPDVIHSHMFHANILMRLLRFLISFPALICTVHNSYEGGRVRTFLYRYTDSFADVTTNVSDEATKAYIDKGAVKSDKIITIKNAISTDKFIFSNEARVRIRNELKVGDDKSILLAVGRLTKQKDYPNLINAFSKIEDKNTVLLIIGDGELKAELVSLAESLDLNNRVFWLGLKNNIHEFMSTADVFVLASRWEGFGLVVAEAMSCKRVVVATDCGGVAEVIGDCGYLVTPNDSEKLATAIDDALKLSQTQSSQVGEKARSRVKKLFSMRSKAQEWLRIYKFYNGMKKEKTI